MIYAEVTDPSLRQDYFRGIASLDPSSAQTEIPKQVELHPLLQELKTTKLETKRRGEIIGARRSYFSSVDFLDDGSGMITLQEWSCLCYTVEW
jgi:hypothetical protein